MDIVLSRCRLRPFREGDQPSIARYANNRRIWINLRDRFPHPYTLADADAWIREVAGQDPPIHCGVEVGGEVVGGIGLTLQEDVHRRSAEIGYWLGEPFWGRGIMSEVVPAFTAYALTTFDCVASMRPSSSGTRPPRESWRRRGTTWRDGCARA